MTTIHPRIATMKPVSDLHFRVVDKGLFIPIARRLARDAGKVSYWSPHEKAFPTLRDFVGDGYSDIQRVRSIFEDKDSVDCFVFPDTGFVAEQMELRSQGFPVWGCFSGCELELSRGRFLSTLESLALPVPPYQKIVGAMNLRDQLMDKGNVFIKSSIPRGDWETFHWRSPEEDTEELDWRLLRIGPFRDQVTFYVCEPIETDNEDGTDTWCIDGEYPSLVIHGMEAKDKAYLGTFQKYADLPEELRRVNDAFAPVLKKYGYRSFFSTEVRITDSGEPYFIDPTCRAGSPPSQVMAEMTGNFADVIWHGANGVCIDPEPGAKFGVQALLNIHRDESAWTVLRLPGDLDRWVKSAQSFGGEDCLYAAPSHDKTGCEDWLVGIGDRPEEAIRHLKHNVSQLPDGVTCEFSAIADLIEQVNKAEERGMEFTDERMPDPDIVIEDKK